MATSAGDERTCWVCFGTDSDTLGEWISPCRCAGSMKYVHQPCLRRWISESRDTDTDKTRCPQCTTVYTIEENNLFLFVKLGDLISSCLDFAAPVSCAILTFATLWAGLGIYGGATLLHVCGRDGYLILKTVRPLKLFFALPCIPLALVTVRTGVWNIRIDAQANFTTALNGVDQGGAGTGRERGVPGMVRLNNSDDTSDDTSDDSSWSTDEDSELESDAASDMAPEAEMQDTNRYLLPPVAEPAVHQPVDHGVQQLDANTVCSTQSQKYIFS